MTQLLHPQAPDKVNCETCLSEIPQSQGQSVESDDYVIYFCGLDCYQQWKEGSRTQ